MAVVNAQNPVDKKATAMSGMEGIQTFLSNDV